MRQRGFQSAGLGAEVGGPESRVDAERVGRRRAAEGVRRAREHGVGAKPFDLV